MIMEAVFYWTGLVFWGAISCVALAALLLALLHATDALIFTYRLWRAYPRAKHPTPSLRKFPLVWWDNFITPCPKLIVRHAERGRGGVAVFWPRRKPEPEEDEDESVPAG